jgi:hypothetical protein
MIHSRNAILLVFILVSFFSTASANAQQGLSMFTDIPRVEKLEKRINAVGIGRLCSSADYYNLNRLIFSNSTDVCYAYNSALGNKYAGYSHIYLLKHSNYF